MGCVYLIEGPTRKSYVGITIKTAEHRLRKHFCEARNGSPSHLNRSIRKYGESAFRVTVLAESDDRNNLEELEKLFIVFFQTRSPKGYNLTSGGEGFIGLNKDIREANRKKFVAAWADPVRRRKRLEKQATEEVRDRHRIAVRNFTSRPEHKAKMSAISKAALNRPEVKALISNNSKRLHADPEFKEKHRAAMVECMKDADRRRRIGEGSKKLWSDPDIRSKRLVAARERAKSPEFSKATSEGTKRALADPEVRRRMSQRSIERWQDPDYRRRWSESMNKTRSTPEVSAKRSLGLKLAWARRKAAKRDLAGTRDVPDTMW